MMEFNIQYISKFCELTIEFNEIINNSNYGIRIDNPYFSMEAEPIISYNNINSCNYGLYLTGNVGAVIQNCTLGIVLRNLSL